MPDDEWTETEGVPYVLSDAERKAVFGAIGLPMPVSSTLQADGSVLHKMPLKGEYICLQCKKPCTATRWPNGTSFPTAPQTCLLSDCCGVLVKQSDFIYLCEHTDDAGVETCDMPAQFCIRTDDSEGCVSAYRCAEHCRPDPDQWGWDRAAGTGETISVTGVNLPLVARIDILCESFEEAVHEAQMWQTDIRIIHDGNRILPLASLTYARYGIPPRFTEIGLVEYEPDEPAL